MPQYSFGANTKHVFETGSDKLSDAENQQERLICR